MRVGVANLSTSVTTKRVETEAERAADWFPIHFPTATVTLTAELEDGNARRGYPWRRQRGGRMSQRKTDGPSSKSSTTETQERQIRKAERIATDTRGDPNTRAVAAAMIMKLRRVTAQVERIEQKPRTVRVQVERPGPKQITVPYRPIE
jgi:hypothetical protein